MRTSVAHLVPTNSILSSLICHYSLSFKPVVYVFSPWNTKIDVLLMNLCFWMNQLSERIILVYLVYWHYIIFCSQQRENESFWLSMTRFWTNQLSEWFKWLAHKLTHNKTLCFTSYWCNCVTCRKGHWTNQ